MSAASEVHHGVAPAAQLLSSATRELVCEAAAVAAAAVVGRRCEPSQM